MMRRFKDYREDYLGDTGYRPGRRFVGGLESDEHIGELRPKTVGEITDDYGTLVAAGLKAWDDAMYGPEGAWYRPGGGRDRLIWENAEKERIATNADWRAFQKVKEEAGSRQASLFNDSYAKAISSLGTAVNGIWS